MAYFAGLDVSVKETSVCIVDDAGKIVREVRVASEPEALLQVLTNTIYRFKRVGLEAGPLSQWLYSVLAEAGLPVHSITSSASKRNDSGIESPSALAVLRFTRSAKLVGCTTGSSAGFSPRRMRPT
jgi:transposase